jgi:hypothetical protein
MAISVWTARIGLTYPAARSRHFQYGGFAYALFPRYDRASCVSAASAVLRQGRAKAKVMRALIWSRCGSFAWTPDSASARSSIALRSVGA